MYKKILIRKMMKIYSVLINKESSKTLNKVDSNPIFVEESFSFLAFIFQSLWLFYNRLWVPAIGLIIVDYTLLSLFEKGMLSSGIFYGVKMVIAVFVAIFAKEWYIENLKRKNYQIIDVVVAKDLDGAKLRFYQNNQEEYSV